MHLSILDIEKGAEELKRGFDKKIEELQECEEKLLEDEKVQLYVFIHEQLECIKKDKRNSFYSYIGNMREKCEHPLYFCVTNGDENTYSYKCLCLNCGVTMYFKQYEMDKLYDEHKVITKIDGDFDGNHFYTTLSDYTEAHNFYKDTYERIKNLNYKLANQDNDSIILAASEITYNHFVHPEKENIKNKVKKITLK